MLIKTKLLHKIKNCEKKVSKCNDFKDYIFNDDSISRHFLIKTIEELNKSYMSFKIDFVKKHINILNNKTTIILLIINFLT